MTAFHDRLASARCELALAMAELPALDLGNTPACFYTPEFEIKQRINALRKDIDAIIVGYTPNFNPSAKAEVNQSSDRSHSSPVQVHDAMDTRKAS